MALKGSVGITVLAALLILALQQCECSSFCPCARQKVFEYTSAERHKVDSVYVKAERQIQCCVFSLLGYEDEKATIKWEFKGAQYPWPTSVSTFEVTPCGLETIETTRAALTDAGTYKCMVTSSNGTVVSSSTLLEVSSLIENRNKPRDSVAPEDVHTIPGRNASFSCKAYVGQTFFTPEGVFRRIFDNGTEILATDLPNVVVKKNTKNDMVQVEMVIDEVRREHFGLYSCDIKNLYGSLRMNVSLVEGIPHPEMMIMMYRTIVIVAAVLLVVSVLVCWLLWRLRIVLAVWWQKRPSRLASRDKYKYDVFVIHGDTAANWVWTVLLPKLEGSGYTCFLPERDMEGGEMIADTIASVISTCRRVLVVMTPCLPESRWGSWSLHSGVHSALKSQTRILALKLQDMPFTLESSSILKILDVVKKLVVPESCALLGDSERLPDIKSIDENKNDHQPSQLRLTIPEIKVTDDWSGSPKRQRLSNMILGSNNTSRENLEEEKGEKDCEGGGGVGGEGGGGGGGGPIIYNQDDGLEDPVSPCSITPFILPSCDHREASTRCATLNWYMRVIFVKDSEETFWLKLHYYLTPPSVPLRCTASYRV